MEMEPGVRWGREPRNASSFQKCEQGSGFSPRNSRKNTPCRHSLDF